MTIYSIVTLGLGLLVGRLGLYSLGQLAVLTIGAWVGARLPDLAVDDNLKVATYALTRQAATEGRARALELFPRLAERLTVPARLLSGGEQQMVVLAQALVSQPMYILIDELSLGLAPVIVNQLVSVIRSIAATGVGVLLIEQFATGGAVPGDQRACHGRRSAPLLGHRGRAESQAGAAAFGLPAARRGGRVWQGARRDPARRDPARRDRA